MNIKALTGFLDAIANLKETIAALRSKDTEFERQLSELRTQNLLLAREVSHLTARLQRQEQRTDWVENRAATTKRTPRLSNDPHAPKPPQSEALA